MPFRSGVLSIEGCGQGGIIASVGETAKMAENVFLHDSSLRLDHVGIAVWSIDASRRFYESLGQSMSPAEVVGHERVKVSMLTLGASRLELLEPVGEDSTIARFLQRRGEGLHHIALHTRDIDTKFSDLKRGGVRLVNDAILSGAQGHRYFFLHPSSCGGVLVEIVGDAIGDSGIAR
jgi:methylmalonyl-CoA epimerase